MSDRTGAYTPLKTRVKGSKGGGRSSFRIDELAHSVGLTVDTVRFYQREGLLQPPARAGRANLYGSEHRLRLRQIKALQQRGFSLGACRTLLELGLPELIEGLFAGAEAEKRAMSREELVEQSLLDAALVAELEDIGLVRDPRDYGREAYDVSDLALLTTVRAMLEAGMPADAVVEVARIYVRSVEDAEDQIINLFGRDATDGRADRETRRKELAESVRELLPLSDRLLSHVHRRAIQRLALERVEKRRKGRRPT